MRSLYGFILLFLSWQATLAQTSSTFGSFVEIGLAQDSRFFHTATLLNDGQVLIVGGNCNFENLRCSPEAETFDPISKSFALTGPMKETRSLHSAVLLPDGRVLISGGVSQSQLRSSAEVYDPATRSFGPLLAMKKQRYHHNSILLPNGKVLIVGGINGNNPPEIFDPATNSFEWLEGDWTGLPARFVPSAGGGIFGCSSSGASGTMLVPSGSVMEKVWLNKIQCSVEHHSMTGLLDGTILIAGGSEEYFWFPQGVKHSVLFFPESNATLPIEKMHKERAGHTATLMPDGNVLVLGGTDGQEDYIDDVEIYSPALRQFSAAGRMWKSRSHHTATLLPNGQVLVIGGTSFSRAVELYEPSNPIPGPSLAGSVHAGSGRLVSATDPARAGSILEIYGAGLAKNGKVPPMVMIGGKLAEVLYFGRPGWAEGETSQINVRVPEGISSSQPVSLQIRYLDRPSNVLSVYIE